MHKITTLALLFAISCTADKGVITYNTAPEVVITDPETETFYEQGETIEFLGIVDDNQPVSELQVEWVSSIDGILPDEDPPDEQGYVDFASASLSPGSHVVTLRAIDGDAAETEDSITVHIEEVPEIPTISVMYPTPGEQGLEDAPFVFMASVSDRQDLPEELIVELSSNPGGQVCYLQVDGMGNAQCVSSMGIGSYVLTFSVTDSDGNTATASTTFNVVSPLDYDFDGDGYSTNGGDCNDSNATIYPGAPEICDGLDNDCNDLTGIDVAGECYDDDGDGYCESPPCVNTDSTLPDCDDTQVAISPDAVEIVNGIDDDCDGLIDEGTSSYDDDGDGYCESPPCINTTNIEMDCDDNNYLIHPNAQEVCNDGIDNNCNTLLNEENAIGCTNYYYDEDGDSYGVSGPTACYCEGGSYPYTGINANDCYDYNADVYPGQTDYFDFDRGDSSYDYNCNNTEEYAVNTLTAGCEWGFFGGFQCNLDAAGWQDTSVPDCGYAGLYVDDCDYSLPGWCLALCGLSGAVSGDLQDSIDCVIQYCNASCNSVQYNMVQSCR